MAYSKFLLILSLIASTFHSSNAVAANVTTLSEESFEQIGKDAFWIISVSCDDGNGDRRVQRNADTDTWCPKGDDSLCNEDKATAAKNACSDAYKAQLIAKQEAQEKQKADELAAAREKESIEQAIYEAEQALQAKILIEEALTAIEQKRLKLVDQELKIERRLTEIEEILKTEGDEEEEEI